MCHKLKIPLLLLTSIFVVNNALAKENDCIILQLQSGSRVVFMLQDNPQIFFTQQGVEISTQNYKFEELSSYCFGDSENLPSGLNDIIKPLQAELKDGVLFINPVNRKACIHLYTILGVEIVCTINCVSDNTMTIDMNQLPSGVYLLNIDNETLKFLKR